MRDGDSARRLRRRRIMLSGRRRKPEDRDEASLQLVLGQVREGFGRVAYSHKTHEKQADIYRSRHESLRWTLVVLTALSSTAFVVALAGVWESDKGAQLVTAFVAVLATGGTFAAETFDFGRRTQVHRDTARSLWVVREQHVSLIADIKAGALSLNEARRERDRLIAAAGAVYAEAPRTGSRAYGMAQKALQTDEELTFTDAELDHLLPPALREGQ